MTTEGVLYHSCVEPDFTHAASTSSTYFPPLIALSNAGSGTVESLEHQLGENWASYPVSVKESLILEDILNVLCGSDGTLFSIDRRSYNVRVSAIIDRKTDATLYLTATEILEFAVMQRKVGDFVQNNERGFVALSFCEVLNVLLQELQSRIAQFDALHRKGGLRLQRFKVYIQPALHTFEVLTMICAQGEMTGTALINVLASVKQMFGTGDARHSLANHLMKQAMEAYCHLIDPWIHFGELNDPCQEFFVVAKRADMVQPQEFCIEWVRVPDVIKDVAQIILRTGCYVRILSNIKRNVLIEAQPLQFTSIEQLKEKIIATQRAVSDELMKYIVLECSLMDVIESVHRFFLMARGDYISIMLEDAAQKEALDTLNLIFHEAVGRSSLRYDSHRDLYSLEVEKGEARGATNTSDVLRMVNLHFDVQWPLQIFFSDQVMRKYQRIFSFLFQLKQTVRALSKIWLSHMKWKRLPLAPSSQLRLNYTFVSIERMLFLCRNIEYLCIFDVAERNFNLMLQTYENYVKASKDQQPFHSIAQEHEQFINQVIEQCMMDDSTISPLIQRALSICNVFSTQVLTFLEQWEVEAGYTTNKHGHIQLERATKFTSELLRNQGYIAMVDTAARQFDKHLSALVSALEESEAHRSNSLLLRLTYNGFFK